MSLESTDLILVNRDDQTAHVPQADLMNLLEDTDLLLVNRNDQTFKITGAELKESVDTGGGSGGGGEPPVVDPDGDNVVFPGTGTGTQEDPYVITTTAALSPGGQAFSTEEIELVNLTPYSRIQLLDFYQATNEGRFTQPSIVLDALGGAKFRLVFNDVPQSNDATYSGLISTGDVWFSWEVSIASVAAGVGRSNIVGLETKKGLMVLAPAAPGYITQNSVGDVVPIAQDHGAVDGKLDGVEPIYYPESVPAPTGIGLKFDLEVNGGLLICTNIENEGAGWTWWSTIVVNLQALGGPAEYQMRVITNPCTNRYGKFQIEPYVVNDQDTYGTARRLQIQVSPNEDMSIPYEETLEINADDEYEFPAHLWGDERAIYIRARYQSGNQHPDTGEFYVGPWSTTVRTFWYSDQMRTDGVRLEWTMDNVYSRVDPNNSDKTAPGRNFNYINEEQEFAFPPSTYIVYNLDNILYEGTAYEGTFGQGGQAGNASYDKGSDGNPVKTVFYTETRAEKVWRVAFVDASGEVGILEDANGDCYGITDEFAGGADFDLAGGSGTGLQVRLNRTDGKITFDSIVSGGADYQVGDLVSWRDPNGFSWGVQDHFDSENDKLMHGLGGSGGTGAGGGHRGGGGHPQIYGQGCVGSKATNESSGGPGNGGSLNITDLVPSNGAGSGGGQERTGGGGGAGWDAGGAASSHTSGYGDTSGGGGGGSPIWAFFNPKDTYKGEGSGKYSNAVNFRAKINGHPSAVILKSNGVMDYMAITRPVGELNAIDYYAKLARSNFNEAYNFVLPPVVEAVPQAKRNLNVSVADGHVYLNRVKGMKVLARVGVTLRFSQPVLIGGEEVQEWTPQEAGEFDYSAPDAKGGLIVVTGKAKAKKKTRAKRR